MSVAYSVFEMPPTQTDGSYVRVRRHRQHVAVGHVHDDGRARVALVVRARVLVDLRPGPEDRGVELLLDDGLQLGVDVRHQVVARRRLGLPHRADDGGGLVDDELLHAGGPAQLGVVLRLEAGAADEVGALQLRLGRRRHAGLLLLLLGGELGVADRAEIAQQVRGVDAVDTRVDADRLEPGGHAGVVRALLHDREGEVLRDVLRDRDGLVLRAVPADRRLLVRAEAADLQPVGDRGVRRVQRLGQPGEDGDALVLLLREHGAVDAHDEGRAVGDQGATELVEDQAAGGRGDDVAVLVGRRLLRVDVGRDDLEEEQPSDHRDEQGHDEDAEHRKAQ